MSGTGLAARALVATVVMLLPLVAGCRDGATPTASEDVLQIGEPPTREWPTETPCRDSLAGECDGRSLYLVATVNARDDALVLCATECRDPSDATIHGVGTEGYVLCRWPLTAGSACRLMGQKGESVLGEAAIYAIVDD